MVNAMRTSYLRLTRTTLWICLLSGAVTFFDLQLAKAKSIDGWDVYGMHGEMTVQGSLTEPACVLAMESKDQSIDLGITSRVSLNRIGNRTDPVTVHFQLKDCGVVGNSPRDDSHGGNITFLPGQLVSYVTVSGVAFGRLQTSAADPRRAQRAFDYVAGKYGFGDVCHVGTYS